MGCHSHTISSDFRVVVHSSGVSALASANNIAVSGGKDGVSVILLVQILSTVLKYAFYASFLLVFQENMLVRLSDKIRGKIEW